jgi:hypothetical protein
MMPLLLLLFQILFLARVTSSEHQRVTLGERRGDTPLRLAEVPPLYLPLTAETQNGWLAGTVMPSRMPADARMAPT